MLSRRVFDLATAARALVRTPGWTVASLATLALVAGTTTAFFSLSYGTFFRSVDAEASHRLVLIGTATAGRDRHDVSPGLLDALRARGDTFAAVAAAKADPVLTAEERPQRLESLRLTPGWLETVKPALALGRGFSAADHDANAPPVALISHRLWQQRFGGRQDVLGQHLALQDGRQVQVRGVLGPGFEAPLAGGRPPHLWLPLRAGELAYLQECRHACAELLAVARLAAGVGLEAARRASGEVLEALKRDVPDIDPTSAVVVLRFTSANMGGQQHALRSMFGASLFLLLVGTFSIGLQLLGRTLRRRREHAIRQAIGAWRGRLRAQIILEGALLTTAGLALGLVVAAGWVLLVKHGYVSAFEVNPGFRAAGLDVPTLAFGLAQLLIITAVITLPACLLLGRTDVHGLLKESSRSHTGSRGSVLTREALLALQIALTVVLQMQANVAALAVLDTEAQSGIYPLGVRQMQIEFPEGRLWGEQNRFNQKVLDGMAGLPGLRAVALMGPAPLTGPPAVYDTATIAGRPGSARVVRRAVGGDVLGTLRMRLVAGRMLGAEDHRHPARPVVVDQRFVAQLLAGQEPLGQSVVFDGPGGADEAGADLPFTIVGVVNDVLTTPLPQAPLPNVYTPFQLGRRQVVHFLARAAGDPAALDAGLRAAVRAADPGQPIASIGSYLRLILEQMVPLLGTTFAMATFGSLAWLLAVAGLRSTTTALMEARTNEIGLRLAIGASRVGIVSWALRQSGRAIVSGTLLGTTLLLLSCHPAAPLRLLGDFPVDGGWLLISAATVAVPVVLAVVLPAWRAGGRSPMKALRHE